MCVADDAGNERKDHEKGIEGNDVEIEMQTSKNAKKEAEKMNNDGLSLDAEPQSPEGAKEGHDGHELQYSDGPVVNNCPRDATTGLKKMYSDTEYWEEKSENQVLFPFHITICLAAISSSEKACASSGHQCMYTRWHSQLAMSRLRQC